MYLYSAGSSTDTASVDDFSMATLSKQVVENITTDAPLSKSSKQGILCENSKCQSESNRKNSTSETRVQKGIGKLNKVKLVHSHQIPDSVLRRFAQCIPAPPAGNLKLFRADSVGTVLESELGKVYAPKQMSRDMFCRKCEDILSSKGESQFLSLFFDRIYNPSDPMKPRQGQNIEYGNWLYHFCVGLIFRNLLWFDNTFLNEDEIYKLFVQCRQCILNPGTLDRLPNADCPEIFMLITPLSVEEEELKHGLMNRVLSGTLEWYIGRFKLARDSLEVDDGLLASFFLFHLGALNILVKFSPSSDWHIDEQFRIRIGGGSHTYHVPKESERKKYIPPGMWAHLQDEARCCEQTVLQQSQSTIPLELTDKREVKEKDTISMFGVVDGAKMERSSSASHGIQPLPSAPMGKNINFLPEGFYVRSENSPESVNLPEGHFILVHHTFIHGDKTGETIFIAVARDSADTPYLIWHNYVPGLQYSVGFHISSANLSLGEVLKGNRPPLVFQAPEFQALLQDTRKKISSVLPQVLLSKGIFKLESLLYRVKALG